MRLFGRLLPGHVIPNIENDGVDARIFPSGLPMVHPHHERQWPGHPA